MEHAGSLRPPAPAGLLRSADTSLQGVAPGRGGGSGLDLGRLVYGVFLAAAVTTFCVRVLGLGKSTRCLPTTLRVLLLSATVVSEVFAAVYLMPATTLATVGTCFSVVLLLAAHLVAARRRR